jgi:hypothetical protein
MNQIHINIFVNRYTHCKDLFVAVAFLDMINKYWLNIIFMNPIIYNVSELNYNNKNSLECILVNFNIVSYFAIY